MPFIAVLRSRQPGMSGSSRQSDVQRGSFEQRVRSRRGVANIRPHSCPIADVSGVGQGWTFLPGAELYGPMTRRSKRVSSMTGPRESHTATLVDESRVLIGGHAVRRGNMERH